MYRLSFKAQLWSLILTTIIHAAMVLPPLIRGDYSFAVGVYAWVGSVLIVCAWIVFAERYSPKLGGKAGQDFYDGFAQTSSGRFSGGPHSSNMPRSTGMSPALGMGYGGDLAKPMFSPEQEASMVENVTRVLDGDDAWGQARKAEQQYLAQREDPALFDGPNAPGTTQQTAIGTTRLW